MKAIVDAYAESTTLFDKVVFKYSGKEATKKSSNLKITNMKDFDEDEKNLNFEEQTTNNRRNEKKAPLHRITILITFRHKATIRDSGKGKQDLYFSGKMVRCE